MPPKIACAFHTAEHITNFCMDKQCLLPLCPTCVKIHSVEHQLMQTIPRYEEVNQLTTIIGEHLQRDSVTIEADVSAVLNAQNSLSCSKMRALQSVDIFRRELQAELEMFCESIQKSITDVFKDSEESLKRSNTILNRNGQAIKMLMDCLHGEKPMRAVIKYLGKFVKEKIDHTHKEIDEISKLTNSMLLGLEIKSEPVKSLKQLLQGLVKVHTTRKNGMPFEGLLIDIYEELTSDRMKESSDLISKNSLATLDFQSPGVTEVVRTEQRINRQAYRSLPHHQIPPQKSPAASIKNRIGLLTSTHKQQQDSQHLIVKTIENDRPQELTATFNLESCLKNERSLQNESTPKGYHMLRPTSRNDNMQTMHSINRSVRQNSEEKRIRTGLMLVQQRPQKGRRISFQRNIKMYNKENCNQSTLVEPFVE